jgi:hypothetical protein
MKKIFFLLVYLSLFSSQNIFSQACELEHLSSADNAITYPYYPSGASGTYTSFECFKQYQTCYFTYNANTGKLEGWNGCYVTGSPQGESYISNVCSGDCKPQVPVFRKVYTAGCYFSCNTSIESLRTTDINSLSNNWSSTSTWNDALVPDLSLNPVIIGKPINIDANLVLSSPMEIFNTSTITINTNYVFSCNSVMRFNNSGTLTNYGTLKGTGSVIGNFNNLGSCSPGNSPGTLTIQGNYTAQPIATHDMEIASISSLDAINISGTAALDGTLNITLLGGFTPNIGDQFTIMTYASKTGTFSTVNLPTISGGIWQINYNANNIILARVAVLPIELTAFKAQNKEVGNLLTWQTASEKNTSHFDIEKSKDGLAFEKISEVKAVGNSQTPPDILGTGQYYSYLDRNPYDLSYYRLKIHDLDGKTDFSKTVSVRLKGGKGLSLKAYPNPTNSVLNVSIEVEKRINLTIELRDILGRIIWQTKAPNTEGSLLLSIPTSEIPDGNYILKVSDGQLSVHQKVVKH